MIPAGGRSGGGHAASRGATFWQPPAGTVTCSDIQDVTRARGKIFKLSLLPLLIPL